MQVLKLVYNLHVFNSCCMPCHIIHKMRVWLLPRSTFLISTILPQQHWLTDKFLKYSLPPLVYWLFALEVKCSLAAAMHSYMANVRDKTSMLSGHLLLFIESYCERNIKNVKRINCLKLFVEKFVLLIGAQQLLRPKEGGQRVYNNKMVVAR